MTECVLVTGASGQIGGDVLRLLQSSLDPSDQLVALTHNRALARSTPVFHDGDGDPSRGPNLEVLRGDLRQPDLGLCSNEWHSLLERVTAVLHCAATTRFSVTHEEAERTNIEGTRNLVTFASRARRLRRFGHVSTAFVSGRRTGPIYEEELDHDCGFVNAYEWSKYEAERLVRASTLPWAVYRLSAVIGSQATGRFRSTSGVHLAIGALLSGAASALPGFPDTPLDFVSDEFASSTVFELFEHFEAGRTYHVCAGQGKTLPLQAAVQTIVDAAREQTRACDCCSTIRPSLVDEETFWELARAARQRGDVRTARTLEAMGCFTPQLRYPKRFDCRATEDALAGTDLIALPLADYWFRIVHECIRLPLQKPTLMGGNHAPGAHCHAVSSARPDHAAFQGPYYGVLLQERQARAALREGDGVSATDPGA